MKKIKYTIITIISYFLLMFSVSAQEMLFFEVDPNYRAKIENSTEFHELTILKINDDIAYSLEPIMPTQVIYEKNSDKINNLKEEKILYLEAISHFASNSSNKKIYMAAQELIWEYLNDLEIYWTDYNDSIISIEKEKNEILNQINNITYLPNFSTTKIKGNYFEDIILIDSNNVLKNYELINNSNNIIRIDENKLKVSLRENSKITLERKNIPTTIYSAINSVDIIVLGQSKLKNMDIEIELLNKPSSYLEFQFLENGNKVNGNVEFIINNKLYKTDNSGYFLSDDLFEMGVYKMEITKLPENYIINEKTFTIELEKTKIDSKRKIYFKENLEKRLGSFHLYRAGFKDEELPLSNIEYELYAYEDIYINKELIYKKDEKIASLKTDENGQLNFENLFIGKYYLKEITNTNYEKVKNISFEITEKDTYIFEKVITNYKNLSIMIIGKNDYQYILYSNDGLKIKELTLKEENLLMVEYGNYYIEVLKNNKLLYTWNITYNEEKNKYVFHTKDYIDYIDFEMPITGKKSSINILLIGILIVIIKKIKC